MRYATRELDVKKQTNSQTKSQTNSQTKSQDLTFEQALAQLEEIVGKLESGDLPLDDALALYEQGQQLAAFCSARLDEAELRVQKLAASGDREPFEFDEDRG